MPMIPNYKEKMKTVAPDSLIVLSSYSPDEVEKNPHKPTNLMDKTARGSTGFKPTGGFWYSTPNDYSWSEWKVNEDMGDPSQYYLYEIANPYLETVKLKTVEDIAEFTKRFGYVKEKFTMRERKLVPKKSKRTFKLKVLNEPRMVTEMIEVEYHEFLIDWNEVAKVYGNILLMGSKMPHHVDFKYRGMTKEGKISEINGFTPFQTTWDVDGGVIIQPFTPKLIQVLHTPELKKWQKVLKS